MRDRAADRAAPKPDRPPARPVVVITGATRGIGRLAAEAIAKRGARVVLACRDPARGAAARDEIAASVPGGAPDLLILDLASLASVRKAAAEAKERFPRIDALVNNAGTFSRSYRESVDGFEISMATNHLGPFLFTRLLLPAMAPSARIVNLSSDVYAWGRASMDKPDRRGVWGGFMNYAASKRAVLQFSLALAAREARRGPEGIRVNALHPGVIKTGIMKMATWYGFLVDLILLPFWTPAQKGVEAIADLALGEDFKDATGGYYKAGRVARPRGAVVRPSLLEEVWAASSRRVGLGSEA